MYKSFVEIPGFYEDYQKAFQTQTEARDASFFSEVPYNSKVADLKPLTLKLVTLLQLSGNPYMVGGIPSRVDAEVFLWVTSVEHTINSQRKRKKFIRSLRKFTFADLDQAISDYLSLMWGELGISTSNSQTSPEIGLSNTAAYLVHLLSSNYGWEEEYILNLPLPRLLMYRNLIIAELDKDFKPFFKCDQVKHEYNKKFKEYVFGSNSGKGN